MRMKPGFIRNAKVAMTAALICGANTLPAFSHSLILPTTTHFSITSKALIPHHVGTTLPGVGSSTMRLNAYLTKQTIFTTFGAGQNYALNQAVGGAVSSGILTGRLYDQTPTNYVQNSGGFISSYTYAFAGNPFNNPALSGTPFPTGNSINFVNNGISFKHGVASGGGTGVGVGGRFFGGSGAALTGSGAQRAVQGYYKSLSGISAFAGEKSIAGLGPVTGGQFVGTIGVISGPTTDNYLGILFAFGNNPINATFPATLPLAQSTYLLFGNVARTVTSGQLIGNFYAPGINFGRYAISMGSNPFNKIGLFPTSSFSNNLFFAAFTKLK
jgi:hypothetical protein